MRLSFTSAILLALVGIAVAQPIGQVSPTHLDFGSVLVGTSSPQLEVTLKNVGDAVMTVSSVSTSGPFAVGANKCQKALKTGASCKVWVTYTPQSPETDTGVLTFSDTASNSPQTVSLTGTGAMAETLYEFPSSGKNGALPVSTVILDAKGNLYGATSYGGTSKNCLFNGLRVGCGTVYKLTPGGKQTVLHNFAGLDGAIPSGGLVLDSQGNLFGTTGEGGVYGYGTVFKLTASGTETVLYSFTGQTDGAYPWEPLVLDAQGNLYGTTSEGGIYGYGTVYKMSQSGNETVMYNFGSLPNDGSYPIGAMVLDGQGNLYGATFWGGMNGTGTVFKVTPSGEETVLHSFTGERAGGMDGAYPDEGLSFDTQGNLYGTTLYGGAYGDGTNGYGTVFMVTPSGVESLLYNFGGYADDGIYPYGVVVDSQGSLYGTTSAGGSGGGTVFKLTPDGTETAIYSFALGGGNAQAGVVFDSKGNLYGATRLGGNFQKNRKQVCHYGCGVVYAVVTK